jgi:glycosyltransferase involved in cell wall biosynthesis
MPPVSIIATELNEIGDIARVIESLLAQEPPAAEIVIVDGGSTDGTWEWLTAKASREPRLIAIRDESCSLKHSRGPVSRGRNVAIAAAKSSTVACADAGCTYAADWLRNLTARIAAGEAEYTLGGVCLDTASTLNPSRTALRSFSPNLTVGHGVKNPCLALCDPSVPAIRAACIEPLRLERRALQAKGVTSPGWNANTGSSC